MESETVDAATISQVMSALARRKTESRANASRENGKKNKARMQDDDVRATISEKQKARRERERQERIAAGIVPELAKPRGRPRTRPLVVSETPAVTNGEKRRGRPAGTGKHQKAMANAAQDVQQQEGDRVA